MTTSSLQGKSVIVTGATKGIGKGIARVFAQAGGAKVLVVSRHLSEAEAVAKELGNGASGFAADVTKPEDMAAMAKAAEHVEDAVRGGARLRQKALRPDRLKV